MTIEVNILLSRHTFLETGKPDLPNTSDAIVF